MTSPSFRPSLRPIETIVVPDARYGKVLVLRDTQGITSARAVIPPPLIPIVVRFTGDATCAEIAKEASAELGTEVPVELVVRLASQLEEGLFLEGKKTRDAKTAIEREFASAEVRPASHAGGAYHADADLLTHYIDESCLARGRSNGRKNGKGKMLALVAPHIDPWRGATGYGHAYSALRAAIPEQADTFVLFGTSHAPMNEPFALCRKAFATPLGDVPADLDAIDAIAKRAPFDAYRDQFNHKQEHSLEFQVVFLKHLLKDRPIRIVPILAGLGEHQVRRTDPATDDDANRFLDAVAELVAARAGRVVVIAGADLAHVGPRFGDPRGLRPAERERLEKTDKASIDHALAADTRGFWKDVAKDLQTRRVCGLGPIYSLLRMLPEKVPAELLHYEQTVDEEDGSIVSHAAVAFFGG